MSATEQVAEPLAQDAAEARAGVAQEPRELAGVRVGRLIAGTIGILLALAAAGIGGALVATQRLDHDRALLFESVVPARRAALQLESALVNQETGVRGLLLTGEPAFLEPYADGRLQEAAALAMIASRAGRLGAATTSWLATVRDRARTWHMRYAEPAIASVSPSNGRAAPARRAPARRTSREAVAGRHYFDRIRAALASLEQTLEGKATQSRERLTSATGTLEALLIGVAALVIVSLLVAGLVLRRFIIRPLAVLGSAAGRVAGGDFKQALPPVHGAREVNELTGEIDAMRERIVSELEAVETARTQLQRQAHELSRSNAELEQFAYVASHDLQEPLRKVASFCQALKTRYGGQLDERADQYIDFAVDGARRMQSLISDLLDFSRVGHDEPPARALALGDAVAGAELALAEQLRASGGSLAVGELPTVVGDRVLLESLFSNLIGNSLKFRGPQAPSISISARRSADGAGEWEISCADNGIGIAPEYSERIFLIFQRLHTRESYEGSGIGLALCRKIVEYHGGRIWLDTAHSPGACFRFTLPAPAEGA